MERSRPGDAAVKHPAAPRARADLPSINTTRGAPALTTPLPARRRHSRSRSDDNNDDDRVAPDFFSLSPIAEAEAFTLTMPESPAAFSPMDVDSATPSMSVQRGVPSSRHAHHSHANNNHQEATRPLLSVFDWDDTLCPSSWLYRNGFLASHGLLHDTKQHGSDAKPSRFSSHSNNATLSERDRVRFVQFEDQVLRVLQSAMQMGPVFIITAATLEWVHACASHFLPRVQMLLKQKADKVHVVSAREWYQQNIRREGDPMAWKAATFDALCAHLQVEKVYQRLQHRIDFVSIGDSVFERDACRQIEKKAPAIIHSKTLKFVEHPSLQELLDQVAMTISIYDRIRHHSGSLDLHITRNTNRQKGDPTLKLIQGDLQGHDQPQHCVPPGGAVQYIERGRTVHMMATYMGTHASSSSSSATIRI